MILHWGVPKDTPRFSLAVLIYPSYLFQTFEFHMLAFRLGTLYCN
ncbi:MAG: hypothetical protein K0R59_2782 [Sphingobacterium sp.]|jgi:hypothetical protein|nr:hypothetical protein [Sphingobacterium sp.]